MSQIIGLCSHYKRCRYCGKEFFYVSGGSVKDPVGENLRANRERDEHERICPERFLRNAPKNKKWNDREDDDMELIKFTMEKYQLQKKHEKH